MLKQYKQEHSKTLANIFFDIYYNKPFNYNWLEKSEIERYFSDLYQTPNFLGYVIFQNNEIIGGCLGIINDYFKNKSYKISEIFVSRKYQGLGYGSSALKELEALLFNEKAVIIELSTDRASQAFKFYKKNGFLSSQHTINLLKPIKK